MILVDGRVAGNIVSWNDAGRRMVDCRNVGDYWGQGVATRALAAFLEIEEVFQELRSRVYADKCAYPQIGSPRPDSEGSPLGLARASVGGIVASYNCQERVQVPGTVEGHSLNLPWDAIRLYQPSRAGGRLVCLRIVSSSARDTRRSGRRSRCLGVPRWIHPGFFRFRCQLIEGVPPSRSIIPAHEGRRNA